MEQVNEQALNSSQLLRHLPLVTVEHQAGLTHDADFLVLELLEALKLLNTELDHVQHLTVVAATDYDIIRPLLRM